MAGNDVEVRFGIVRPADVPEDAVVLPPGEWEPAAAGGFTGVSVAETTVRALALQVAMENNRLQAGWAGRIALYRELRMDPPWPGMPKLRTQFFLPANGKGEVPEGQVVTGWTHGVPAEFTFPAGVWYWIWDI